MSLPLSVHHHRAATALRVRAFVALLAVSPVAALMGACSSTPKIVKVEPVSEIRTGLTPARSTADNMVRLDAQLRSGCSTVTNIDRPDGALVADVVQTWTAHTCHGDLVYNVTSKPSADGPIVEVTPAGGAVDAPPNPHFKPAMPDATESDPASDDAAKPAADAAAASATSITITPK